MDNSNSDQKQHEENFQFSYTSKNKSSKVLQIIIAVVVLSLIAIVAVIVVKNNIGHKEEPPLKPNNSESFYNYNNDNDTADLTGSQKASSAESLPAPVFTVAEASSVRGTDSEGGRYSVNSVLSNDIQTKWVPQKSDDGGIGEWIQISAPTDQYVRGVEIFNGYHKDSTVWSNNNRVKACTLSFSNGTSRDFILDDTIDLIRLDLGEVVQTRYIRLTINSIYKGTKWNDTAITYIGAY